MRAFCVLVVWFVGRLCIRRLRCLFGCVVIVYRCPFRLVVRLFDSCGWLFFHGRWVDGRHLARLVDWCVYVFS